MHLLSRYNAAGRNFFCSHSSFLPRRCTCAQLDTQTSHAAARVLQSLWKGRTFHTCPKPPQWDVARCQLPMRPPALHVREGDRSRQGVDVSRGKGRERTQGWSGHAQRGLKTLGWGELNSKHSSPTKERWSTQDKKLQHTLSQIYKANVIYAWDPDLKTVR